MALTPEEILLILRAKDQATATLNKVMGSSKKLELSFGALAKGVAVAGAALVGLGVGGALAIAKLGQKAGQISAVEATFRSLAASVGETSDALLGKLRAASDGMVDDLGLMQSANQFLAMGLAKTGDEAANLTRVATQLGAAMGRHSGPTEAMSDFALMLANQSIMRLDQFGISSGRVRQRIEELQTETAGMTRETAFMTAVMEEAEVTLGKVGDQTGNLKAGLSRLQAAWSNMTNAIARSAGPLVNDVARDLQQVIETYRPAIETLFTGFFETLRALWRVARNTIKHVADILGLDAEQMATDAQGWAENVMYQFAQGLARGFQWVVSVLNRLGEIIAEWLEPHSPPKILPHIDKWGRDTIQAYLDGMVEGIDYEAAHKALQGITRFFEKEMRPLNQKLSAISHERADILGQMELEEIERMYGADLSRGFRDPRERRLVELRMEEIKAAEELRDLEAERDEAVTAAEDILFPLERQVELTEKLGSVTRAAASAAGSLSDAMDGIDQAMTGFDLGLSGLTLGEEFAAGLDEIFAPLEEDLERLVDTWSTVFSDEEGNPRSLGTILAGAFEGLGELLGEVWREDIQPAMEQGMSDAVDGVLKKQGEKIKGNWDFFWEEMGFILSNKWELMRMRVNLAILNIRSTISGWYESLKKTITLPFEDAQTRIEEIYNTIKGWWEGIKNWWGQLSSMSPAERQSAEQLGLLPAGSAGVSSFASGADFVTHGPKLMLVGEAGPEHVSVTPLSGASAPTYSSNSQSTIYVQNPAAAAYLWRMQETRRLAAKGAMI